MPQQQQKDVYDQALEEWQGASKDSNAPEPAPQWQQFFEKNFPAAAQAAHQMAQVPQGLMQMAGSVAQLPEAIMHPLDTVGSMLSGAGQTIGTVGRGIGALVAPNSVQAPTQQAWDQATQNATQNAAGLMVPAIPEAATMAGIPQAMARAGSVADMTPSFLLKHPVAAAAKAVAGPLLRAGSRALFEPEAVPKPTPTPAPTPTIDAQFMGPQPEPYQDVASKPVQKSTQRQLPAPEAPKPKLAEGPTPPKQLAPVKPGTQTFQGQDSGLGPQPHQDVVAQRPMVVRTIAGDGSGGVPGRMRLETVNEMKARLANFGRGVTKQPTAEAEPLKLPKPTPPKKAKP